MSKPVDQITPEARQRVIASNTSAYLACHGQAASHDRTARVIEDRLRLKRARLAEIQREIELLRPEIAKLELDGRAEFEAAEAARADAAGYGLVVTDTFGGTLPPIPGQGEDPLDPGTPVSSPAPGPRPSEPVAA